MDKDELIKNLQSKKYGFPFFLKLVKNGHFFDTDLRRDIEKRRSDTLVFNRSIKEVFEIQDSLFKECYDAVVNGEGGEKRKIHSLRSSSLLGLLAFYKVHSGQCIKIDREINDKPISFIFDKIVFEKTNRVFHPSLGLSSIDIALYGTANDEPCVLYLESKFTEYLERKNMMKITKKEGKTECPISSKYTEDYNKIFSKFDGLKYNVCDEGIELLSKDENNHYCEGIKQMISHFIGARNSDDLFKGLKVFLGTILFDFSKSGSGADPDGKSIEDYRSLYSKLAKSLNDQKINNLTIIEEAWTYQDFFENVKGYELDKLVKEYYQI